MPEPILGTCHRCGRAWLAGHVCGVVQTNAANLPVLPIPDADPRRVVVIDPATDNVTTIIGKASVAPGVGELRERIAEAIEIVCDGGHIFNSLDLSDAVLRVILGDSEAPS